MTPGQIAYGLYVQARGGAYPQWSELKPASRAHWEFVTAAADTRRKD